MRNYINNVIKKYFNRFDPNDYSTHTSKKLFDLANSHLDSGEHEDAINLYILSIKKNNSFNPPFLVLRNIELTEADILKLTNLYFDILKNNPSHIRANINLADLYTRIGQIDDAIIYFKKVVYTKLKKNNPEFIKEYSNEKKSGSPDFMIIGAEKSGTSSLFQYLIQHPRILTPVEKEIHFFTQKFSNGMDWYKSQFAYIPDESGYITGEASTSYIGLNNDCHKKIHSMFPNIKIIICLRNPVERAISDFHQMVRLGKEARSINEAFKSEIVLINSLKNSSLKQIITSVYAAGEKGYLLRGMYHVFVQEWLELFPTNQILIIESSELNNNTRTKTNEVFNFLNLHHFDEINFEKYNSGTYNLPEDKLIKELHLFFKNHNDQLYNLININFHWDK